MSWKLADPGTEDLHTSIDFGEHKIRREALLAEFIYSRLKTHDYETGKMV